MKDRRDTIGLLIVIFLHIELKASYPDFFGTSPFTQAIGNQANLDQINPSNNYYIPASLAHATTPSTSISLGAMSTDFEEIKNIVVKNRSGSDTFRRGDVSTDYKHPRYTAIHLALPVSFKIKSALGISYFSPLGNILEVDSGSANLPEYVMYRSRHKRPLVYINYALALNDRFSLSLGTHFGFQSTSRAYTQVSLNGADYGSSSQVYSEISSTMGGILSLLKKTEDQYFYFSYQQQMKSNIAAEVFGEINDPTGLLFSITLNSMIYYDPHIFRMGWAKTQKRISLFLSLEHQLWKQYKPPTITIVRNSGIIQPSDNYDHFKTKNITIPKLGLSYAFSQRWSLLTGLSFRPTPLEKDFSGSGNTLDADSITYSIGPRFQSHILGKKIDWGLSGQYRFLKSQHVVKSPLQENGSPGEKIGSSGYKIGGRVLSFMMGLNVAF